MNRTATAPTLAPQLLAALNDPQRLQIVGALAGGANRADLAALVGEKALAGHLKRLASCGLVTDPDGEPALDLTAFATAQQGVQTLRIAARGPAPLERPDINALFEDGLVRTLPVKPAARDALLEWIAERFFTRGSWTEGEVNAVLGTVVIDHATVRRFLIDQGRLRRSADGSAYARP
ncbi:DUF2087 domain-containing protein [Helcobacillus massiliensis]|uniref:DUF2087 domain-containing protein n=1 Tax=Helcobacillus massiliensis TaxID=521392 RepID=A0A839QQ23_9MICO|nr:DUF2087 domain-containing protein [Helcobacillus massiliensis]MBB3021768.1 hypothetical protein [Helcobacillus massiliensis]